MKNHPKIHADLADIIEELNNLSPMMEEVDHFDKQATDSLLTRLERVANALWLMRDNWTYKSENFTGDNSDYFRFSTSKNRNFNHVVRLDLLQHWCWADEEVSNIDHIKLLNLIDGFLFNCSPTPIVETIPKEMKDFKFASFLKNDLARFALIEQRLFRDIRRLAVWHPNYNKEFKQITAM